MYGIFVFIVLSLFVLPLTTMNSFAAESSQSVPPAANASEARIVALWFKKNGRTFSQSLEYGNAPATLAEWYYSQYSEAREAAKELPAENRDQVVYHSLKERFRFSTFDEFKIVSRALRRYYKNREKYKKEPAVMMVSFIARNGFYFSQSFDYQNAVAELISMYCRIYKEELAATARIDEPQRSQYIYKRLQSKYEFKSRDEFDVVTEALMSLK